MSLEAAAANHFGCNPELCIAVPGSEAALRLIARLLDLPGLYRPPCYGTYRTAFAQAEPWAMHDDLPEHATVLVLGNPNNPDGLLAGQEALLAMLRHQQRCGGWLIVDEAFADCDPSISLAAMVGAAYNSRRSTQVPTGRALQFQPGPADRSATMATLSYSSASDLKGSYRIASDAQPA